MTYLDARRRTNPHLSQPAVPSPRGIPRSTHDQGACVLVAQAMRRSERRPRCRTIPQAPTDFDQARRDLDQQGLCLIPDVLRAAELAEARERLLNQAAAERDRGLDFRDGGADKQILDERGVFKRDGFSSANGGVNQRLWLLVNRAVAPRATPG